MGAAPNGNTWVVLTRRTRWSGGVAVDWGEHYERLSDRSGGFCQATGIQIRQVFATEITRAPARTIGGIDNPIVPELGDRPETWATRCLALRYFLDDRVGWNFSTPIRSGEGHRRAARSGAVRRCPPATDQNRRRSFRGSGNNTGTQFRPVAAIE